MTNSCSFHPPGGTALARQFQFPALSDWNPLTLGPMMTGPAKSEDRRGSEVSSMQYAVSKGPIIGAKGFPSAASLVSVSELCSMQLARATFINTHTETPKWHR